MVHKMNDDYLIFADKQHVSFFTVEPAIIRTVLFIISIVAVDLTITNLLLTDAYLNQQNNQEK